MQYIEKQIKKGIKLHLIKTEKFKTNLIAVFLTLPMARKEVTKNALISAVLRRGCKNIPTSTQISQELEEMYGASFDNGIDKIGDNHVLKFYLESINDNYLLEKNGKMLEISIEKLLEIIFEPLIEDGKFKEEYVQQEKENIKRIIAGKADNKASYAYDRCIEEMYKNKPYGLYKYGYTEDLEKITAKELYDYYLQLISKCKIDIIISGNINDEVIKIVQENENIKKLEDREPQFIKSSLEDKAEVKEKEIIEEMDVTQGKIVIGMDLHLKNKEQKYIALVYNAILGGSANSKLFQEVREKASLAYTAGSIYIRYKSNVFIKCGIEIKNYSQAIDIIKKQLEDMKKGDFSEEELQNIKKGIISTIKSIDDEQDTEVTYFFGQELSIQKITIDEYIKKIENVTKEQIIEVANTVTINTIYFLRNFRKED